jgi:hypothetical protein
VGQATGKHVFNYHFQKAFRFDSFNQKIFRINDLPKKVLLIFSFQNVSNMTKYNLSVEACRPFAVALKSA